MTHTVLLPLLGGALIGLAALTIMLYLGRIAGISGILGGLLAPTRGDLDWRALFVAGLLVGGAAAFAVAPDAFTIDIDRTPPMIILAGLLVGFGTRLGSGCTSGHGVCGVSRLSPRSLVATATFIFAGMAIVALIGAL